MTKPYITAWNCLVTGFQYLFVAVCIYLLFLFVQASSDATAKTDKIIAECPVKTKNCTVRKTQMAKFAQISRYDYATHVCEDGRIATANVNSKTLVSTYQPFFADMRDKVEELAKINGCIAE